MNAASAITAGPGSALSMGWRQAPSPLDMDASPLAASSSVASPAHTPPLPAAGAARAASEASPVSPGGESARGDSLTGRYTSLAFVYNQSASRLVMLYRSPTTGETESQAPSEAALRLYETVSRPPRRVATSDSDSSGPEVTTSPVNESPPTVDIVVASSGTGTPDAFAGGRPGFGPPPQGSSLTGGETLISGLDGSSGSATGNAPTTGGSGPRSGSSSGNTRLDVVV